MSNRLKRQKIISEEQLKAFLEKIKSESYLEEKLKAAADADAVVSIAKDAGFMITVDDLKTKSELSEAELEGLAGGHENTRCGYIGSYC